MINRARPADGVAWVTGASSGIGRGVALELARRGYTVAVTARRVEALEALIAEAGGAPGRIVAHAGDVTDSERMAEVVDTIARVHGPIVLAFLNAGGSFSGGEAAFDAAIARKTLDLNLGGVINCLGPLIAPMTARGMGQIAINASIAGYGG